jgi:hypothetical protein
VLLSGSLLACAGDGRTQGVAGDGDPTGTTIQAGPDDPTGDAAGAATGGSDPAGRGGSGAGAGGDASTVASPPSGSITSAEVEDLEDALDEIDQLLAGVELELNED